MSGRAEVGRRGEELACSFLASGGYSIVARNWRSRRGEIDIIARLPGVTAFVEVKTRRGQMFGEPEEAVTAAKARRIRALAIEYLQCNQAEAVLRFDVISIRLGPSGEVAELKHIVEAF